MVMLGAEEATRYSVDYDAIGPTVHLAARMEQMAPPGAMSWVAVPEPAGRTEIAPLPLSAK